MRSLVVARRARGRARRRRRSRPRGGWASVGFEPLPDGTSAGATWSPTIFVKQHGVTPLAGLQPVVMIDDDRTGRGDEVPRDEPSEAGVYEADVVFPAAG